MRMASHPSQANYNTAVLKAFDTNHDFHEGVWLCAVAFVLAGVFALFVNAEKPVTPVEA